MNIINLLAISQALILSFVVLILVIVFRIYQQVRLNMHGINDLNELVLDHHEEVVKFVAKQLLDILKQT